MKNNETGMIQIPPATPITAKDDLEWALVKLQRAKELAVRNNETPTASYIVDAIDFIRRAHAKIG